MIYDQLTSVFNKTNWNIQVNQYMRNESDLNYCVKHIFLTNHSVHSLQLEVNDNHLNLGIYT